MIDYGYPDPADQASTMPPASPTPLSGNSLNPPPAGNGVQTASTNGSGSGGVSYAPPPEFKIWANSILEQRMGAANYRYVSQATKDELIQRIWNDSGIQGDWAIYESNPSALGALTAQISAVIMGQGDDPTVVNDYVAMKNSQGVGLTAAEQVALAGATQAQNAPVPRPFGNNVVSGYDFGAPMPKGGWSAKAPGQSFGWATHNGVDYGTRAGDRIVSPFSGTVTVETNVPGYGNYVYVTLDNGWKIGFGHVAAGEAQTGSRVNPGDLIAIAGANVGSAQGSVTIVTWQDPQGHYVNPHDVLDPIFAGTTFNAIGAQGAAGTGMPTVNKILDTEYPTIKSDWQTYFGSPPSPEDVYNVIQHGSDPAQWSDYIRSLPGHIDGMTVGQTYDLRQTADQVSMKVLGHPSTDGLVKDLYDQQLTTPQAVTNWYNVHGVTGLDAATYNKAYTANAPIMKNVFNETGVDPRDIKAQGESNAHHRHGGAQSD